MAQIPGLDPTDTPTTPGFALGTVAEDHLGREFVYVHASGAIAAGDMCIIGADYEAAAITATLAAHDAGAGLPCGLALVAFADNDYGWLARRGTGADFLLSLVGVCDDFQPLAPTTTAGKLDNFDAGSATAPYITGCVITTASAGAEKEICVLEHPTLETNYPA